MMKKLAACFVSSLLFISIISDCDSEERLQNKSIAIMNPGTGIGNINLGDGISDVLRKLEMKPTGGKTVRAGTRIEYWLDYSNLGVSFIFDESRKLSRIAVSNPGIIVQQRRARVSRPANDIDKTFGAGESRRLDEKYEQRIYRDKGISFIINRDTEKIETVIIEKAAQK